MKPIVLFMLFSVVHLLPQDERISAKSGLDARIVYGRMAKKGQFPWHVDISVSTADYIGRCGGSLIGPQWVLTAGHCFEIEGQPATDLFLLFGAIHRSIIDEDVMNGSSSEWFVHEDYNSTTLHADIALIKLRDSIKITRYIMPIKLGSPIRPGTKVQVPGSGYTENSMKNKRLYYANLTTIRFKECNKRRQIIIDNSMVCTEISSKQNICDGDSGGGLVRKEKGEWKLVGVASFAIDLPPPDLLQRKCKSPSGFTRISSYKQWISNVTKKHP